MDTGPEEEAFPHVQSGPEEFAAIVGHMLDVRDKAIEKREKAVDDKLDQIGSTLKTLANGIGELIEAGRVNEVWKRRTDQRLDDLERWKKELTSS